MGEGQEQKAGGESIWRPIRLGAVGPIQKRIGAGLMPGRGSAAKERRNQEDVMNVRAKNPEKKVILRYLPPETRWLHHSLCQGYRGTDYFCPRVSLTT